MNRTSVRLHAPRLRNWLPIVAGIGVLWLGLSAPAPGVHAQASTATVTIIKNFLNATGQYTNPPSGSAAGVVFTLSSTTGSSSATFTTIAGTQVGQGTASGTAFAGSYIFQEMIPTGTTFQSATISQNGQQYQTLSNGGAVTIVAGSTYTISVTDQITAGGTSSTNTGIATLTINKSLSSSNGQATTGPLNGYTFTLTGQSGAPTQTMTTDAQGHATFPNLPAGVYALAEQPVAGATFGSMTINGLGAQQGQSFQLQAGGTYSVNVTNIVSGAGNVTIQKQIVDQNNNIVSSAPLAGFTFTISTAGATSGATATVTTSSSGQAVANIPAGAYQIAEAPSANNTLVGYTINNVPTTTGAFTVALGQTTAIVVTNRLTGVTTTTTSSTTPTTGTTRTVTLQMGCNNVTSTFSDGTPSQMVASFIVPQTSVNSIWRYDNAAQVFRAAYFPPVAGGLQPPVDISAINRLDAIFICVTTPATLTEPGA